MQGIHAPPCDPAVKPGQKRQEKHREARPSHKQESCLCAALHDLVPGLEIMADHEGGPVSQLARAVVRPPVAWALGHLDDIPLTARVHAETARRLQGVGVDRVLAPVADVLVAPRNPVIGSRSFGESKEQVSRRGIAYIKGLQDNGILAVAKHFPGHGDTDTDSHRSLPVIHSDMQRLTDVDLYPFVESFAAGVKGVMVAHLYMPNFDSTERKATTLSYKLVTGLLKQKMNYQGLVFTDALNMKSVSPSPEGPDR